jgi:opacity protein-like surface antigen
MRYARVLAIAGATVLCATASQAADMGPIIPPPIVMPPVKESFSSWYLRGDIGFSNQEVKRLHNALYAGNTIQAVGMGFDGAPLFGLGVGYRWNSWLRTDVTGEYRARANFHGLDIVNSTFTDEYRASKSEWLFLANAYLDLGTWYSVTPFVGAGIGMSRNTIHSFLDVCTTCPGGGVAFGPTFSKWDFAWAAHAGLAYAATKNLTVEIAYRYVSLGNAQSGDLRTYLGANTVNNPMEFRSLSSHDVKLGVRWAFGPVFEEAPIYSPPAPHPVYADPPSIYAPPPQPAYPAYPAPIGPRG